MDDKTKEYRDTKFKELEERIKKVEAGLLMTSRVGHTHGTLRVIGKPMGDDVHIPIVEP